MSCRLRGCLSSAVHWRSCGRRALLEHLLVRELDLAVKVLKSCGLAKAEDLVVDETILEVVKLVNILHNFLTLSLYKVLDKRISANGNPKANVAVDYEGLEGEQGTDVCEGGISSEQALCGRVRLGRRDTLDENLGLVIEVQASVLLEDGTDVREYLERNGELGLDVTVVGVGYCAGVCLSRVRPQR